MSHEALLARGWWISRVAPLLVDCLVWAECVCAGTMGVLAQNNGHTVEAVSPLIGPDNGTRHYWSHTQISHERKTDIHLCHSASFVD